MDVQRPSPESDTRPENSARSPDRDSARAVRSSSQEPTTLPLDLHARIEGQTVTVKVHDAAGKPARGVDLRVLLDDALLDPAKPVDLVVNGRRTTHPAPGRRLATMAATLASRGDPQMVFTSEINTTSP